MLSIEELELLNAPDAKSLFFLRWLEDLADGKIHLMKCDKKSERSYESSRSRLMRFIGEVSKIEGIEDQEEFRQHLQIEIDKLCNSLIFKLKDTLDFCCWRLIRSWTAGIEVTPSMIRLWKTENPLMSGKTLFQRLLLAFVPEKCTSLERVGIPLEVKLEINSPYWSAAFIQLEKSPGELIFGFSSCLVVIWLVVRGNIFTQQKGINRMINIVNSHGCLIINQADKEWNWNYGDGLLGSRRFDIAPFHSWQQTVIVNSSPIVCLINVNICSQYREKLRFWKKFFLRTTVTFPNGLPNKYGSIDSITMYDVMPFTSAGRLDQRIAEELEVKASY